MILIQDICLFVSVEEIKRFMNGLMLMVLDADTTVLKMQEMEQERTQSDFGVTQPTGQIMFFLKQEIMLQFLMNGKWL